MLPACPNCTSGTLARVPRSLFERLLYRKVQQCSKCGFRVRERRVPFQAEIEFVTARHTRCIQCGNLRVRRLPKRDVIDRMSTHPISLMASLARAPIYHCNPCRLQYHDWRQVHPSALRERGMPGQPQASTQTHS